MGSIPAGQRKIDPAFQLPLWIRQPPAKQISHPMNIPERKTEHLIRTMLLQRCILRWCVRERHTLRWLTIKKAQWDSYHPGLHISPNPLPWIVHTSWYSSCKFWPLRTFQLFYVLLIISILRPQKVWTACCFSTFFLSLSLSHFLLLAALCS